MKKTLLITFSGLDGNFGGKIHSSNLYGFLNLFSDVEYTINYIEKKLPSDYEKFYQIVFGGDQILQMQLYQNHIHKYLGPNINKKIIVFGSSFGNLYGDINPLTSVTSQYLTLIKNLKKIMPIGVRETNQEVIEKFGLKNFHVCDPALLLGREDYEKMLEEYPINKKDFSFGYYVWWWQKSDPEQSIPEDEELDIVSRAPSAGNVNPLNLSIGQWLWLIKNCKVLYTNSFHTYLFGTLFNKRVIFINPKANNMIRMEYFKNYYQIEYDKDRNITNYDDVIKRINIDRRESILYLYKKIYDPITAYYARNKDNYPLSSSGGISKVLSRYIIQNNGCVYGVAWKDLFHTEHICIESMDDYYKINGSKYIPSKLPKFKEIKDKLDSGKLVMFVGTPCQIRALQIYLYFKQYPNLLLVDLLCSSIFDPKKYKEIVEKALLNKNWKLEDIDEIRHRWKECGKPGCNINININSFNNESIQIYKNGIEFSEQKFLNSLEMCKKCPCGGSGEFKKTHYSDITIGDAWKYFRNENSKWSRVLINTKKGLFYFNNVLKDLYTEEVNVNYMRER